ncbi:hypothetical protein [Nostoc sp.]|uniref:hypothetical protein n=1 Tax=Nostoc sp. TaxID=1180 RepID=UPI002FF58C69
MQIKLPHTEMQVLAIAPFLGDLTKSRCSPSEPTTSTPKRIVEATGALLNAKGQIVLSANSSTATPHTSRQNPIQCHGS